MVTCTKLAMNSAYGKFGQQNYDDQLLFDIQHIELNEEFKDHR